MTSPELFEAAVNVVRNMPKEGPFNPSDELKLKFYAFYKQATVGPNNTPKPRFYDVVNLYKWNAWKKLENMPPDEARQAYVDELKKIIETMSLSEDVSQFYELLGPFYEFQNHQHQQQAPHSSNTSATNTRESTTIGNKKASVTTNAPARTSNNTTPPPSSSSSDQSFVGLEMEKTHTTVGQVCRGRH
ncbi:Acyl-CoA-binding domain-containing protein 5, partial [Fragariocoptes setiger]